MRVWLLALPVLLSACDQASETSSPTDSGRTISPEANVRLAWSDLAEATSACHGAADAYEHVVREFNAQPRNFDYEPVLRERSAALKRQCRRGRDVATQVERVFASADAHFVQLREAARRCRVATSAIYDAADLLDAIEEGRRDWREGEGINRAREAGYADLPNCLPSFRAAAADIGVALPETTPRAVATDNRAAIRNQSADDIIVEANDPDADERLGLAAVPSDRPLSAHEQQLADDYIGVVRECRGGSESSSRCRRWAEGDVPELARMNAAGLCFGRTDQSFSEYEVHRCGPHSLRN